MTGIEEKISRLPPELQKEVEDYIDFLVRRHAPARAQEQVPGFLSPPPAPAQPKPIILADEIPFQREPEILPGYKDLGEFSEPEASSIPVKEPPVRTRRPKDAEPGRHLLDWID